MKLNKIPFTPEIATIARRVVWFEEPQQAIENPARFLAYAMTYGDHEVMQAIRKIITDEELRSAIEHAPPGIFDARSWAYWNLMLGRFPTPPMPERSIPSD